MRSVTKKPLKVSKASKKIMEICALDFINFVCYEGKTINNFLIYDRL